MTSDQAMEIIENEDLRGFNWFDDHKVKAEEVGIRKGSDTWSVYTTDERATPLSVKEFHSESEALENFIKRLRAQNRLFKQGY